MMLFEVFTAKAHQGLDARFHTVDLRFASACFFESVDLCCELPSLVPLRVKECVLFPQTGLPVRGSYSF